MEIEVLMKKTIKRIILIVILLVLLAGILYAAPKVVAIRNLQREANTLVSKSTEATFMESKTTIVYDYKDEELCQIKNSKDMYYVSMEEIPETLADAFIVMEDNDFYTHSGIDYKAIIRAAFVNSARGEIVQGASTITQQLARNIFLSQDVTWERKIEEMFIAEKLEKKYDKDKILEFYLNNIYFGNGYYGVEAAAKGYFDKSVSELTISEQAFIAAVPNGPTRYNPLTNFDNTMSRRNVILRKLYDGDYISSMTYYTAYNEEVQMAHSESTAASDSVVTYVRHCATESLMEAAGFTFRYNFESEEDYESYQELYDKYYIRYQQALVSGGYTVYTSINPDMQEELQTIVDEEMSSYTELSDDGVYKMQASATCVDNETGNVVAIVGSRSQEDSVGLHLNRAYQSYRQSGSAIKPISVYLPYFMQGHTPDETMVDEYMPDGPVNADRSYAGEMTLKDAVKYSKNTIAWKIYQEITPKVGMSYLTKLGFKKVWYDKDYTAAALGGFTYGVTSEEMAGAYAAIANDGTYRKATCIRTIYGAKGELVRDESQRGNRVYSTNCARVMTDVMLSVMEPGGTGASATVDGWQIAGKSGSTNSDKDVWFCGYSPYYTLAVWMGYDYPEEINGDNATQPIFKRFMTKIHENLVVKTFAQPKQVKDTLKEEAATSAGETETAPSETGEDIREEYTGVSEQTTANPGNVTNPVQTQPEQTRPASGSQNTQPSQSQQNTQASASRPSTDRTMTPTQRATLSPVQSSRPLTNNGNNAPSMVYPGADVDAW